MRTNQDLDQLLKAFLEGPFADMPRLNRITIAFGRRAKRRFGSINMKSDQNISHIRINGLFKDESIPEDIIRATIAHELCHYAHGFCSPLPQKYKHPHQGGVIFKEMKARGLADLYRFEKQWTKQHWAPLLGSAFPQTQRRPQRAIRRRKRTFLEELLHLLQP